MSMRTRAQAATHSWWRFNETSSVVDGVAAVAAVSDAVAVEAVVVVVVVAVAAIVQRRA